MPEKSEREIRLLLLGDTHSGNKDYPWGNFGVKHWQKILEPVIEQQSIHAIVHTGDFTDKGNLKGIKRMAALLKDFRDQGVVTIAVEGNHDPIKEDLNANKKILIESGGVIFLDTARYVHPETGFGFTGTTNFTGNMGKPDYAYLFDTEEGYNTYGEEGALKMQRDLVFFTAEGREHFVLTHFPPVEAEYREDPQRPYPTDQNSLLGNIIETTSREKVIANFHGHYHRGMTPDTLIGGTPLINTAVEHAQRSTGSPYTVYRHRSKRVLQ